MLESLIEVFSCFFFCKLERTLKHKTEAFRYTCINKIGDKDTKDTNSQHRKVKKKISIENNA